MRVVVGLGIGFLELAPAGAELIAILGIAVNIGVGLLGGVTVSSIALGPSEAGIVGSELID